jgi:hypothetical protein
VEPHERARLLVRTANGLEPASLWLGEHGMPITVSGWKQVFASANERCWVNDYCARRHRHDPVPPVGEAPGMFATRQFRRSLAWHIARRPGG